MSIASSSSSSRIYWLVIFLLVTITPLYIINQPNITASPATRCDIKQQTQTKTKTKVSTKDFSDDDNIVYGHLHMAKTAGTEINSYLSLKYVNVCGNKGYSFNAYKVNEMKAKQAKDHGLESVKAHQVDQKQMLSWGFASCDYISMETGWKGLTWEFWKDISNYLYNIGGNNNITMELHIPCRDPLEHFMSSCNHKKPHILDCNADENNMEQEYRKCVNQEHEERFNIQLTNLPHITTKCFNPLSPTPERYLNYMSQFLKPQRIFSTTDFVHGKTNEKRNRTNECIWQQKQNNNETTTMIQQKWKDFLLRRPYYKYCNNCIGSSNDLFVAAA